MKTIREGNWNAIVFISVKVEHPNGGTETSTGTGFIVDPAGWVLTCNHLLPKPTEKDTVTIKLTVGDRTDPMSYTNQAIRHDEESDLALLKLPVRDAGPWRIVKRIGDADTESEIAAFGFPLTEGLVSKNGRITNKNGANGTWIMDAPVNPGMSGGPVFNQSEAVVGVVAAGYQEAQNLTLLIPVSSARVLLQRINSPLLVNSTVIPHGGDNEKPVAKPVVYSETVDAYVGDEFSYSIQATGSPQRYFAFGLPRGLKVDHSTGEISGNISNDARSSYHVDIRAENQTGSGKGELTVQVKRGEVEATPTPSPLGFWASSSRVIFQNGVLSIQNGNVYTPNGAFVGYIGPPNVTGSAGTLIWTNGTASHFMSNGSIVNLYPNGTAVVGRWK